MNKITNEFVMEKLAEFGTGSVAKVLQDKPETKPVYNQYMTDQRKRNAPASPLNANAFSGGKFTSTANQAYADEAGSRMMTTRSGMNMADIGEGINREVSKPAPAAAPPVARNKNKITTGTTRGVVGPKGQETAPASLSGGGLRGMFGQVGNALKSGVNAVTKEQVNAELAKRKPVTPQPAITNSQPTNTKTPFRRGYDKVYGAVQNTLSDAVGPYLAEPVSGFAGLLAGAGNALITPEEAPRNSYNAYQQEVSDQGNTPRARSLKWQSYDDGTYADAYKSGNLGPRKSLMDRLQRVR